MVKRDGCHVMAKPSGSVCNLECEYCFYLEKEKLYPTRKNHWQMTDATLEAYVRQYIEAQGGNEVHFAWQGGEPTLLGIDFYQQAIEFQKKYSKGKVISNSFQTNGLLLDDNWCQFLQRNNFLIGLSIDGPERFHDKYRVSRSKKGSFSKVLNALTLLQKYHVDVNILCVVNSDNVECPNEVYSFFKSLGVQHIQFIPIVERRRVDAEPAELRLVTPNEKRASQVTSWSVAPRAYGKFLSAIYDEWVHNDVGSIYVQMFDTILANWLSLPSQMCIFSETCGDAFVLEANGDVYVCDHYVYPEYKLGNINNCSIDSMNKSSKATLFGKAKSSTLPASCKKCEFLTICYGGCPKHRIVRTTHEQENYFCESYKIIFKQSKPTMEMMKMLYNDGYAPALVMDILKQK